MLLSLLALAGGPLVPSTLAQAAGRAQQAFVRDVAQLRAVRLVRTADASIELYHDRVRRAVLAGCDESARRRGHEQLARTLETSGSIDAEALLVHWRGAGDRVRAAAYAAQAAEQANGALAFERAAELYAVAVELFPDRSDGNRLREKRGDALANAGRQREAADAYLAAIGDDTGPRALDLRRRAAEQLLVGGHFGDGLPLLSRVLAAAGVNWWPSPWRAVAMAAAVRARLRWRGLHFSLRPPEAIDAATRTQLEILRSATIGLSGCDALGFFELHTRRLLCALDAGERRHLAHAMCLEAVYDAASCRAPSRHSLRLARLARDLAAQLDDPLTRAYLPMSEGGAATYRGYWRDAQRQLEQAERILRDDCNGVGWELNITHFLLMFALSFGGEIEALRGYLPEWLRQADERRDIGGSVLFRAGIAVLLPLADGDPDAARRNIELATPLFAALQATYGNASQLLGAVMIDLYDDAPAAAWQRLLAGWSTLGPSQSLRQRFSRVVFWDLRGRAALRAATVARGWQRRGLLGAASGAAGRVERERLDWATPLAQLLRAGVAELEGERQRSRGWLDEAGRRFEAAGMAMHAAVARRRHCELGGSGDDGSAWFQSQGIVDRERFTRLLAPIACSDPALRGPRT
jgi:hypothetical protein